LLPGNSLYLIHTCGERVEIDWAKDISDNEWEFSSLYSWTQKLCPTVQHREVGVTMKQNTECETVANIQYISSTIYVSVSDRYSIWWLDRLWAQEIVNLSVLIDSGVHPTFFSVVLETLLPW
jgi:hypothetical protein